MRGNQGAKHGLEVLRLRNRKEKKKGSTINFKLLMLGTMFAYPALYVLSEHNAQGGYNNDSNERG